MQSRDDKLDLNYSVIFWSTSFVDREEKNKLCIKPDRKNIVVKFNVLTLNAT